MGQPTSFVSIKIFSPSNSSNPAARSFQLSWTQHKAIKWKSYLRNVCIWPKKNFYGCCHWNRNYCHSNRIYWTPYFRDDGKVVSLFTTFVYFDLNPSSLLCYIVFTIYCWISILLLGLELYGSTECNTMSACYKGEWYIMTEEIALCTYVTISFLIVFLVVQFLACPSMCFFKHRFWF